MIGSRLRNAAGQIVAFNLLAQFDRLDEAEVSFTFHSGRTFLSAHAELLDRVLQQTSDVRDGKIDRDFRQLASAFEELVLLNPSGIDPLSLGLLSAASYWLGGYSANGYVLARATARRLRRELAAGAAPPREAAKTLLNLLCQDFSDQNAEVVGYIAGFIRSGDSALIEDARSRILGLGERSTEEFDASEYVASILLQAVVDRIEKDSFWSTARSSSVSAKEDVWRKYMTLLVGRRTPLVSLWPSQQAAIKRGLLDGSSSVVMQMPTSSGKTRLSEMIVFNDLSTDAGARCLYLAPFRALVSEVESTIGATLAALGEPVVSLYGGSEANQSDLDAFQAARLVIATPEKIAAVLKLGDERLDSFGTVVVDEGHLIDSVGRGPRFEMQLAALKPFLGSSCRIVLLSAVLPNADDVAKWIGAGGETLISSSWIPTERRVAKLSWPVGGTARIDYIQPTPSEGVGMFVPRVLEEDEWSERHPVTGHMRKHRWPDRGNKGEVAAAVAFGYASQGGQTMIYAYQPRHAEAVAQKILDRLALERPIKTHLVDKENAAELRDLAEYVESIVGSLSALPQAVRAGFAFHHGKMPHSVRQAIETEYRRGTLRLLVATGTLAQGVNLPARTIVLHSLPRSDTPARDFWNLVGRAGRGMKETRGDIVLLQLTDADRRAIGRYLDKSNIEPLTSQILELVRRLVETHITIDESVLQQIEDRQLRQVIDDIDAVLLDAIAEDAVLEELDEGFTSFTGGLFAMQLARESDAASGSEMVDALQRLLELRRAWVLTEVPEGTVRRAYARTGLSVAGAKLVTTRAPELMKTAQQYEGPCFEALVDILTMLADAPECGDTDLETVAGLAEKWIKTGDYAVVYLTDADFFGASFLKAVEFVEHELGFRIPWLINGLLRAIEQDDQLRATIPEWLRALPRMLLYGAENESILMLMSMGLPDRKSAQILLELFVADMDRSPTDIADFVQYVLAHRDRVNAHLAATRPRYFSRVFDGIIRRRASAMRLA